MLNQTLHTGHMPTIMALLPTYHIYVYIFPVLEHFRLKIIHLPLSDLPPLLSKALTLFVTLVTHHLAFGKQFPCLTRTLSCFVFDGRDRIEEGLLDGAIHIYGVPPISYRLTPIHQVEN